MLQGSIGITGRLGDPGLKGFSGPEGLRGEPGHLGEPGEAVRAPTVLNVSPERDFQKYLRLKLTERLLVLVRKGNHYCLHTDVLDL